MKKLLLSCVCLLTVCFSFAASFTPGNIVVVRIGTGTGTLSTAAAAAFLDEYTPSGILVQSIALPTTVSGSNHIITASGSATSEGALTLSADGQYLTLCGYDAAPATTAVGSTDGINRTVARIGIDGVPNTATGITVGGAYLKSSIRGAVTNDGTGFWTSGTSTSGTTGGVFYVPFGSFTSSPVQISNSVTNTRVPEIVGGQLYVSAASGLFHGVNQVGSGLPTTTGQTTTNLPGFQSGDSLSSEYGFSFFDLSPSVTGQDVIYVTDDRTTGGNGGLIKYSLVSGTWVKNGSITVASPIRAVTGSASGSTVTLFVTSETGVYTLTDASGYNQTITGSMTSIATAATNTKFRGLAFAPAPTCAVNIVSNAGSITNVTCNSGSDGSAAITTTGGSGIYTYNWGSGAATQTRSDLTAGTYTVTVNDGAGCTDTAGLTITQPAAISIASVVTNLPCGGGNTGAIDITVTGGAGGYHYLWSNNATTEDLSGLSVAQQYTVGVEDMAHCTASASANVSQSGDLAVVGTVTDADCHGAATGGVSTTITGGTPTYNYSWTGGTHGADLSGVQAGAYTLTLTDDGGCTLVNTFTVDQPDSLVLGLTATDATSFGAADGSVNLTVAGGTPTYVYFWSNNLTTQNINGLTANEYCVTVSDNNHCTASDCATVGQPLGIAETDWMSKLIVYSTMGALNINLELKSEMKVRFELCDVSGAVIYSDEAGMFMRMQEQIPSSGFSSGYYFLRVITSSGYITRKVVIIN